MDAVLQAVDLKSQTFKFENIDLYNLNIGLPVNDLDFLLDPGNRKENIEKNT